MEPSGRQGERLRPKVLQVHGLAVRRWARGGAITLDYTKEYYVFMKHMGVCLARGGAAIMRFYPDDIRGGTPKQLRGVVYERLDATLDWRGT